MSEFKTHPIYEDRKSQVLNYILIRLEVDKKLNEFKKPLEQQSREFEQEISENGISIRRLNDARVMFEKSSLEKSKSPIDDIDKILNFVYDNILGIDQFSIHSKANYYNKENLIVKYYENYFLNKEKISNYKKEINEELNEYKKYLKGCGFPTIYLPYLYKKVQTELNLLNQYNDPTHELVRQEYKLFNEIFDDIAETVINEGLK